MQAHTTDQQIENTCQGILGNCICSSRSSVNTSGYHSNNEENKKKQSLNIEYTECRQLLTPHQDQEDEGRCSLLKH